MPLEWKELLVTVPTPHDPVNGDVWHRRGLGALTLVHYNGAWFDQQGVPYPHAQMIEWWLEGVVDPVLVGGVLARDLIG